MSDRLLTLLEFATVIAKSERTARRIVRGGEIPAYRIGASLRLRESDVNAFIESRLIVRGPEPSALKTLVRRAVQRARERRAS